MLGTRSSPFTPVNLSRVARLSTVVKLAWVANSATVAILTTVANGVGEASVLATVVILAGVFSTGSIHSLGTQWRAAVGIGFNIVPSNWYWICNLLGKPSKAPAEAQRAPGFFAVASIFLAAGLIALLRLDDKLSSCFLFIHGLLE